MSEPVKILLVEDSQDDAILLTRALRNSGYDVSFLRIDTKAEMQAALKEDSWDLVISDYNMPSFTMNDALQFLQESGFDIPFIIVSGAIGEETAVEAMRSGAHDYIMKNNLARLVPAIERELREAKRRSQRRQAQEDLKRSEQEKETLYYQQATLAEIGRIITSSYDINNVYDSFALAVRKLIPFDRLTIGLMDAGGEYSVIAYVFGIDVPGRRKGDHVTSAGTVAEQAIKARSPMIVDINELKDKREQFPGLVPSWRAGLASVLAVPLISNDNVIGTLQFRSLGSDIYQEYHKSLAQNIATQISGAVANAQLYVEQQRLKEQLLHAQKMEAVGRLAGGIAHDFNNLLTPIMSYAQMCIMKIPEDNKLRNNLQDIYRASERAADLVSKLLAFSKRNFIEPKVIELNGLVKDIESIARRLIGEHIELITELSDEPVFVKIDPGQMEQVLMNLIVNSRDAMSDGGSMRIRTSAVRLSEGGAVDQLELASGDYVTITVTDSGDGMNEEVLSHVFEPFFTTKVQGKGTGLGLSTCYGIVKQSQGHIEVNSREGQGTTITVYLPFARHEESGESAAHYDDEMPRGTETILIVEDDAPVLDMSTLLLSDQGYNVLAASNGVEALKVAREHSRENIHLLLTDIVMPVMGGWTLSQELKTIHPETKVLYTSGYTDDEIIRTGLQDRSLDFVPKPYSPNVITRKIREVLDKSGVKSNASASV